MSHTVPDESLQPVVKSDAAWRAEQAAEWHRVLRQQGTGRAGTSPLNREKRKGVLQRAGCGATPFVSDHSLFMHRTEVRCARCGCHLGHVFLDGARETTGQPDRIDGVALKFKPADG